MKNIRLSKNRKEKTSTISLRGYYQSLPDRVAPKQAFLEDLAKKCGVTMQTVRNWVLYGIKPLNPLHKKIISEVTKLKEEDLWVD